MSAKTKMSDRAHFFIDYTVLALLEDQQQHRQATTTTKERCRPKHWNGPNVMVKARQQPYIIFTWLFSY
jgi:hypothetical protein